MLFRQLFDPSSSTYTYLLADERTGSAILIDPVMEQTTRDIQLLRELGLTLLFTLETHVHADHVTSSGVLRTQLGSKSVMSAEAGVGCADRLVGPGERVEFGSEAVEVRLTPGHTPCSLTFVHHESGRVFTGDALLIRGCGRTDFQGGDPQVLYRAVHRQILSLPESFEIYPGHDYKGRTVSTVGEEKRHNPRLGEGRSEAEFVEIMNQLDLPRPKLIDIAVPANQRCGFETLGRGASPDRADPETGAWAPIARSPQGAPEVSVEWVREHPEGVQVVDVREPEEFEGELGHLPRAQLIPLGTLADAVSGLDPHRPLVVVCRSGGRSGKGAKLLEELGFKQVASMAGGMLRWNATAAPAAASCG
ncbi:MAG: MBL fold metallo-hydrolase [Myxococcota bacterium]